MQEDLVSDVFRIESIPGLCSGPDADALLQSLLQYPPLWHASLALGGMHKRSQLQIKDAVSNAVKIEQLRTFAVAQYKQSMGLLLRALQQQDGEGHPTQEMVLLASILYYIINTIAGNAEDARMHARSSMKMFDQWKFWQRQNPRLPRGTVPARMIASQILCLESRMISEPDVFFVPYCGEEVPVNNEMLDGVYVEPFTTVLSAAVELRPLIANIMMPTCTQSTTSNNELYNIPNWDTSRSGTYHEAQQHWEAKLRLFLEEERCGRITLVENDIPLIYHLKGSSTTMGIILNLDESGPGASWDAHETKCTEVIDDYCVVVNAINTLPVDVWASSPFVLRSCYSLWLIARCTQHLRLRQRAMDLIRQWPTTQGDAQSRNSTPVLDAISDQDLSNSVQMGSNCSCIALEYICAQHRVVAERLEYEEGGMMKITMKTAEDVANGRPCRVRYKEGWAIAHVEQMV